MALTFEYEKDIQVGSTPFISHEPDSTIYCYYIVDDHALDKTAIAEGGMYDNAVFENEDRHLTTKAVYDIGIKNFPGIGSVGFYKDLFSDACFIAAPVHTKADEQPKRPTLSYIGVESGMLHIVVEPPKDTNYTCYRIVVRQGAFAFEYIMYKTEDYVDVPTVKGDYLCHCLGYDELSGTVSENSPEVYITIEEGVDTWAPIST